MSLTRARLIAEQAVMLAAEPYRLALAAQIEGMPAETHWQQFRTILERAYVLAGLEAVADSWAAMRRTGRGREQFQRDGLDLEPGPFAEAVAQFEGRIPRLSEEVRRLIAEASDRAGDSLGFEIEGASYAIISQAGIADEIQRGAFMVTSATTGELLDLRAVLAQAMRGELGSREIRQLGVSEFVTESQARGIRNLTTNRLENIYRTNLGSSYNEAAGRILEAPDVSEAMPLVMLNEIRDSRTRGNPNGLYPNRGFHWQMDGFVGSMAEFRRLGIVPPNGYQCRAGIRGVTLGEALAAGWVDENGVIDRLALGRHNGNRLAIIERGDYPDPGFKGG